MIRPLSQEELAERWKDIKPYIESAIEHGIGETSAHDMFVGAMKGTYECWETLDKNNNTVNFGFVRLNIFEQHKQLQIVTSTNVSSEWDEYGKEGLDYIEATAKELNCKYVTIWGRPGWQKKLKNYGYNYTYAVMTKEIK
jgi:hypothetical protein